MVEELRSLRERRGQDGRRGGGGGGGGGGDLRARARRMTARVDWVQISGHTYHRFHVAVIDPNGHGAYTCFAAMISEGSRVAESNVYERNLKRHA
jgi:hypothetical protein